MIYDSGDHPGDGVWHCPFTKAWVERMAKAAKHCEMLSAMYIEATVNNHALEYVMPPGNFLDEEQDERGLPMSYCRKEAERYRDWPDCCTAIYDYDSIPEVVITNGKDDWPLDKRGKVLNA
jgi:hypothetical protein